jgi:hypothetical protein
MASLLPQECILFQQLLVLTLAFSKSATLFEPGTVLVGAVAFLIGCTSEHR